MSDEGVLDEAYEQLHRTGPEFEGFLSNHGPMAADALIRLGHGECVPSWVARYVDRLEPAPESRWPIAVHEWRDPLGDASRLGDWCALLHQQVHSEPWDAVLTRWWPRLLPGAVASATHGLIRTGHAVRALRERVTGPRLEELGQALAYWAARWYPLPSPPLAPFLDVQSALDALPACDLSGGIRARLAHLGRDSKWLQSLGALAATEHVEQIPVQLDQLVDAAVSRYATWGHANPVMLVHAATAPRAVALVLPSLPDHLWSASYDAAWAVTAAVAAAYRPSRPAASGTTRADSSPEEVAEQAVVLGDEHAVKFTEVAIESHQRGNQAALSSAMHAVTLIASE